MLPANYPLTLQRGDSYAIDFIVKDNAGALVDLTGSNITFELVSGPVTISLDSDADTLTVDLAAAKISVRLTATQTDGLPPPSARQGARYELRRIITGGDEQTLLYGTVTVKDCIE
ncbi:hypothetical protein [Pleomorphomonas oryzae]|uniref:hypothetical protein n=1 Tax=Pleomorphomonas oryzae TaxID=261934 RepID=UPI000424D1F0|nr:hypothetical protein [Pleomorphomonas oryzae]